MIESISWFYFEGAICKILTVLKSLKNLNTSALSNHVVLNNSSSDNNPAVSISWSLTFDSGVERSGFAFTRAVKRSSFKAIPHDHFS